MILSPFKKVILADQAPPDTDELVANVAVMERNDADGTFFVLKYTGEDDAFAYDADARCAGGTAITYDRLATGIAAYKSVPFKKFWCNVLKTNLRTPNDLGQPVVDCFDPTWRLSFPHNLAVQAQACVEMGVDMMFVDLEPDHTVEGWSYFKYTDRPFSTTRGGTKSFEEYEDRMYEAGQYTAYRLFRANPKMTVILSLDAYDSVQQVATEPKSRNYGLLPAWVAGFLSESAKFPMAAVHSFFENQYNRNTEAGVAAERRNFNSAITESLTAIVRRGVNVANAKQFGGKLYKASTIRTDWPTFDNVTPANSHHTPALFQAGLYYGLLDADEFQFIYTEGSNKWCSSPRQINAEYPNSLKAARIQVGLDPSSSLANIPNCIADVDPNLWGLANATALTGANVTTLDRLGRTMTHVGSPTIDADAGGTGFAGINYVGASSQYTTFDPVASLLSILGSSGKLSYTFMVAFRVADITPDSTMQIVYFSANVASNSPLITLRMRTNTNGVVEHQRANGAGGSTIIPSAAHTASELSTDVEIFTVQNNGTQGRIFRGDTETVAYEAQDQHSAVAITQLTFAANRTNTVSTYATMKLLGFGAWNGVLGVEQKAYARRLLGARCGVYTV